MEEGHAKELRDLQSRITQKKKQATKKNRKAVQDECERWERELKERHAEERGETNGNERDDDLEEKLNDLALQTDEPESKAESTPTPQLQDEPLPTQKKPSRQKVRLARRAAEQEALASQAASEALDLPDLKALERERMLASMTSRNLIEHEIRADGHCLYSAIADQLHTLDPSKPKSTYKELRIEAADFISGHKDDFAPFLEDSVEEHVRKVKETAEWGGQPELLALGRSLGLKICVLRDYGRVDEIGEGAREVWLGYYEHGFGLGEHYNSLRKKDAVTSKGVEKGAKGQMKKSLRVARDEAHAATVA